LLISACSQEAEQTSGSAASPTPVAAPASAAVSARPAATATAAIPARIVAARGGFIPEGIEFDNANRRFLTGSLAEGTIFEVGNDGSLTALVDDAELVSSVGIEVDEPRDRLLVANSDRAVFGGESSGHAKLGVYSLTTGERIAMVDLGAVAGGGDDAEFFVNDVTVTDDGSIYATDSRMNVVYRVDASYTPSLFYRFAAMEGLGLNGIVTHPDGYLIVVASAGQGVLYKVPLDDPQAASQIALAEPVTGSDGLVWAADGTLASISNATSSVVKLTSSDAWASATVTGVASFEGQATTGAAVDDDIFVVQPHFNDPEQPVILRAAF
jgi:sugar lactone lactonase YvrE